MKIFLDKVSQPERDFYNKAALIAGIPLKSLAQKQQRALEERMSDEQIYDFCRFNIRDKLTPTMIDRIRKYRQSATGNSCLHIASQYGNLPMMKYLLENKLNDPNQTNSEQDTSLMHALRNSTSKTFEKSILLLSSTEPKYLGYSDLNLKDRNQHLAHQITLTTYSKSRARIVEILKELYLA